MHTSIFKSPAAQKWPIKATAWRIKLHKTHHRTTSCCQQRVKAISGDSKACLFVALLWCSEIKIIFLLAQLTGLSLPSVTFPPFVVNYVLYQEDYYNPAAFLIFSFPLCGSFQTSCQSISALPSLLVFSCSSTCSLQTNLTQPVHRNPHGGTAKSPGRAKCSGAHAGRG